MSDLFLILPFKRSEIWSHYCLKSLNGEKEHLGLGTSLKTIALKSIKSKKVWN